MRKSFLLVLALCFPACARQLGEINPQPNVLLIQSPQKLVLDFGPAVLETGHAFGSPSFLGIDYDRWHETLTHGFQNGFFQTTFKCHCRHRAGAA